jgi:hypothetical protein
LKLRILTLVLVGAVLSGPAFGRDIDKAGGASLSIKTLTELGIDLDHPYKYGLDFSVPELALTLDLFGYQHVTNKVKSNDPVGFLDLTLGQVQIRFANGSQPDYNNPGQIMTFGFNDPASGKTGYFGPLYLQNVRSGILWGDWILQLGVGGTDSFWDPWHRESVSYSQMASSWAYLDTRVQYQRGLIPTLVKDRTQNPTGTPDETGYWAYDDQTKSATTGVDELSALFPGPLVGLQYAGPEFSAMIKAGTSYGFDSTAVTESKPNGASVGLDYAFTPTSAKGFRVLGSVVAGFNQISPLLQHSVSGGVKVGYDLPLPRSAVKISSVEPYAGVDVQTPVITAGPTAMEASAGVTLHWPGMNGWGFDYLQGNDGRTGNVYSGATIAYKAYLKDVSVSAVKHSVQVTWYNDEDGGIVNNLGSELAAQWFDLANPDGNNALEVTAYFGYKVPGVLGGVLVPWTKIYWDNVKTSALTGRENNLKLDGGVKLKKAIRNAELGITYQSRNLTGADNNSLVDGWGKMGILKCSVQISL